MPSLDIIIVNWNAGQQLRDCLESIKVTKRDGFELERIVVVDNASSDASLDGLDSLSLPLEIIRNMENKGFGAACNQGAALSDADYILFLNPDTRLFEKSLIVPLGFMEEESNKKVGICGIQLIDESKKVARVCANFPSLSRFAVQATGLNKLPALSGAGIHMSAWDHLSKNTVDHVIGAFFFMRRAIFENLNGFDERFFVYLEDIDFSLRAKQAGWSTVYLSEAQAFHHGGGTSQQVKAERLFYSLRSRLLFVFKHFPSLHAWGVLGLTMLLEPVSRTFFSLLRGGVSDTQNVWRGYGMLFRELPKIIRRLK